MDLIKKMATSGFIKNIFYPNLIVSGSNVSSEPNLHVFQEKETDPNLFGHQSKLITYVSEEKMIGEFVLQGYEVHKRSISCYTFSNYSKQKIPKKNRKCPHEGVEGVLGLVK